MEGEREDDDQSDNPYYNLMVLRRSLRESRSAFVDMPDFLFEQTYRMPKALVYELCQMLYPKLKGSRSHAISTECQVLTALRFYAEGGYQRGVGLELYSSMAQTTVSKVIRRVTDALCDLNEEFITFPITESERRYVAGRFRNKLPFRSVLGSMDCTIVALGCRPSKNENLFYSRKCLHALNVQVITDFDGIIRNVEIAHGSANDQSIWRSSIARQYMCALRSNEIVMDREGPYYLIGDGGYFASPILLTPLKRERNQQQIRYNQALCYTRVVSEQSFGWWKEKWRSILKERPMHHKPEYAAKVIIATAVLYNFQRKRQYSIPSFPDDYDPAFFNVDIDYSIAGDYHGGVRLMKKFAQRYF